MAADMDTGDMGDTAEAVDTMARKREKLFLNLTPNQKPKLPLLPKLILKPKLMPTMVMVDTVVDMDMLDMAVDTVDTVADTTARDLLNLTLKLKPKLPLLLKLMLKLKLMPTMVMVDTDMVVDTDTVDTVDTVADTTARDPLNLILKLKLKLKLTMVDTME